MYGIYIGALIREMRERLNMTQEELASDFCAVSTLQRIENGEEIPGRMLVNQIFSCLGSSDFPNAREEDITDADALREFYERKIREKLFCREYDYGVFLEKFAAVGEMNELEIQKHAYYLTMLKKSEGDSPENLLNIATTALALTLKSRTPKFVPTRKLLTAFEARLVRQVGMAYRALSQNSDALDIMRALGAYYTRGIAEEALKKTEMPIAFKYLSDWELEVGNANDAAIAAQKGIQACSKYGVLYSLPALFHSGFRAFSKAGMRNIAAAYKAAEQASAPYFKPSQLVLE